MSAPPAEFKHLESTGLGLHPTQEITSFEAGYTPDKDLVLSTSPFPSASHHR